MNKIDNFIALDTLDDKQFKTSEDDVKLREQTDQFEAFLLKKVLDISLKHENKLFGKDPGDKIYQSMYNDTFSKAMSGNIGFSQMLFDYLKDVQRQQGLDAYPSANDTITPSSTHNLQV